jgi:DNA-binding transcriptional ArsR family regulator
LRVEQLPKNVIAERALTTLSDNTKGAAEFLKSAAHPARLRILTSLLQGDREFSRLVRATGLSRTALSNHIDQLIEAGLVERRERGEYRLTADGKRLLDAAASAYVGSLHSQDEERALVSERYAGLTHGGPDMKLIGRPASFVPCWLSYVGSVAGALKALGASCDATDVGGYSGYAFIVSVFKYGTCPSSPTTITVWEDIFNATENLGFTLERYEDATTLSPQYSSRAVATPEWVDAAKTLFERVKREIAERNQPVVMWGLVAPEFGIVNGFQGRHYIVSTIRTGRLGVDEEPVAFSDLFVPVRFLALFFRERRKRAQDVVDREALETAVRYASGEFPANARYVVGPPALKTWAEHLSGLPEKRLNYHGNAYMAACVSDGRWICGQFLGRLATRHQGEPLKDLQLAAECYRKSWNLMQEFKATFPFPPYGASTPENRKKGATILEKAIPLEKEAVEHMKAALEKW